MYVSVLLWYAMSIVMSTNIDLSTRSNVIGSQALTLMITSNVGDANVLVRMVTLPIGWELWCLYWRLVHTLKYFSNKVEMALGQLSNHLNARLAGLFNPWVWFSLLQLPPSDHSGLWVSLTFPAIRLNLSPRCQERLNWKKWRCTKTGVSRVF